MNLLRYFKWLDPFVLTLVLTMVAATLIPCRGQTTILFERLTAVAIFLLFFLHGAKLSREALWSGASHWRLHLATLLCTYALFPVIGMMLIRVPGIDPTFTPGLLYLTLLPSTVQSSIAFTSMAKGNVSAAVCAATLSNILGMFITPLLVSMLMQLEGASVQISFDSIKKIGVQLLLPFLLGHLARPWIGNWVQTHKAIVGRTDRSSILLVVYTAFSSAVVDGLWQRCSWTSLFVLIGICAAVLAVVLGVSWWIGKWMRFAKADSIVLLFCGSKKSLASGVPMAGVLFPPDQVGIIILPLMIFHQIQLIVCALIARRMAGEVPKKQKS